MPRFKVTEYPVTSDKLKNTLKIAMLSDLHGFCYGENNIDLITAVKNTTPDLILLAGDMITCEHPEQFPIARDLLRELVTIAPVYYSNGNHELRSSVPGQKGTREYLELKNDLISFGVKYLNNETAVIDRGEDTITVFGLDLPDMYYRRFASSKMTVDTLLGYLNAIPDEKSYNILIAHNPMYGHTYARASFDMALCGHNHGGLICLPFVGSIISPSFKLFPEFAFGDTLVGQTHIITSRGLGTHRYNIRINNPAELLYITVN